MWALLLGLAGGVAFVALAHANPAVEALSEATRQDFAPALRTFVILTLLSFIPALLIGLTSFTRIIIVLALLRHALGIPQTPPNSVLITLAIFLTLFSMGPVIDQVDNQALQPYMAQTITASEAIDKARNPIREFMVRQTRESDLQAVIEMARAPQPKTLEDVKFTHLATAFLLSELKTAFQIGFLIFLPFIVIDLVVATVLMSLGMMMMSPTIISLPFKLLLFVLVDGWALTMGSLAQSFAS